MRAAPGLLAKLISVYLLAWGAGGVVLAQAPQQPSTRIVAFGSGEPEATKPAETSPEVITPKPTVPPLPERVVSIARVIPPAPKVYVYSSRKVVAGTRSGAAEFVARPAVATALTMNSSYGIRYDPFTGAARMHTGVDLTASYGQTVGSAMSGTVAFAGTRGGYGTIVIVDHGGGISTYYAHLSALAVAVGQQVAPGEVIGYVGSTGRSTGAHLHYEVRANGHPLNPFAAIALENDQLYVEGKLLKGTAEAFSADALPVAPGGTQISVVWDAVAVEKKADGEAPAGKPPIAVDPE
jgi:murein DD-endopeptidase MepM/ murein hydrolase activator NlpD